MTKRVSFGIRAVAALIDVALGVVLSLLLASSVGLYFARRAVVTLHIGQPGTVWQGPLPMVLGIVGEVVYLLPLTVALVWAIEPLSGATIGKRALGLHVFDAKGPLPVSHTLWNRFTIETVGSWGWTLALVTGRWEIALAASVAGFVVLAGCFAALGSTSRTLHDRLSGTAVYRRSAAPA